MNNPSRSSTGTKTDESRFPFLEVPGSKELTEGDRFDSGQGERPVADELYLAGIADVVEFNERGDSLINWDRYRELIAGQFDLSDPHQIVRTQQFS